MSSKELLRGYEVDLNTLLDSFQKEVQRGAASEESEIESYIQDLFMCVLDRFDMPSPLRYGKFFGDIHKPRLRRPVLNMETEKSSVDFEAIRELQNDENEIHKSIFTKEIPDFPKSTLNQFITFEEKVGVIYSLYCIFKEQCLEPKVCIHIPIDLLQQFVEFVPQLQEQGVLDALYILQNLWQERAFVCDVIRRPPGFLSFPLESSEFEAQGLRDLAFHLKTSLQDLGKIDKIDKLCDEYTSLQQQVVRSKLGHELNASNLMTFNGDVGTWLKSVMAQETTRVHQGITGLSLKKSRASSKPKQSTKIKKQTNKTLKKTNRPTVEALDSSFADDSWGIQMPGIPKAARLVMIRDRKRRRDNEQAEETIAGSKMQQKTLDGLNHHELQSEDFYQACSDFRRMQSEEKSQSSEDLSSDDEDLRNWQKTVESLHEELQKSEKSSK